jgi:hypothetical protein
MDGIRVALHGAARVGEPSELAFGFTEAVAEAIIDPRAPPSAPKALTISMCSLGDFTLHPLPSAYW